MLNFSISYPDLINFPYFPDTTERGRLGILGAGSRPKNRVTFKDNFTMYEKN
jgi:hypothetical protein